MSIFRVAANLGLQQGPNPPPPVTGVCLQQGLWEEGVSTAAPDTQEPSR